MERKLIRDIKDCFGNKIGEEICFSLPPTGKITEPYKIIHRPSVPELDNFVERYLQEDNQP